MFSLSRQLTASVRRQPALNLRPCTVAAPSSAASPPVQTPSADAQLPIPTSQPASLDEPDDAQSSDPLQSTDHPLFTQKSKRRVLGSPTLPLEAVALSHPVQSALRKYVKPLAMRSREFNVAYAHLQEARALETYRFVGEEVSRKGGAPKVTPPPYPYSSKHVAAYAANRVPGTFTSSVHVLSEVRRILPVSWNPTSFLDYGCGAGTAFLAATRVWTSPSISDHCSRNAIQTASSTEMEEECEADGESVEPDQTDENYPATSQEMPFKHAWLVDYSPEMLILARSVLKDAHVDKEVKDIMVTRSLTQGPPKQRKYDLVMAAYSVSELIKETMVRPGIDDSEDSEERFDTSAPKRRKTLSPMQREKVAEMRAKKLIRRLWKRTSPGGVLVIIEDGTAAGFETVLFARELLLSKFGSGAKAPGNEESASVQDIVNEINESELEGLEVLEDDEFVLNEENTHARVVAPCIHSKKCPLEGSVSRRRVCRFVQRLNRPPLQREKFPRHNAFEDEYFSYIAIQKVDAKANSEEVSDHVNDHELHGDQWGRLIRAPLKRNKHIAIDACTKEAQLERRVVTRTNSSPGYFAAARRTRWGDIWPKPPASKSSPVNF